MGNAFDRATIICESPLQWGQSESSVHWEYENKDLLSEIRYKKDIRLS